MKIFDSPMGMERRAAREEESGDASPHSKARVSDSDAQRTLFFINLERK
jgi:hypothetical protein